MLCLACLLLILAALGGEYWALNLWRRSIPLRIHVHGTRGKSSTTRELARLLRQQGLRVVAKTTGDAPEYILPDASVQSIRRFGPARITEHIAIIRKAARLRADALVVEGMALQHETLWASERILRANIAVIVNVRPDHQESMGVGEQGVAQSLALLLPAASQKALSGQKRFQLFLSAEKGEYLIEQAQQKGFLCTVVPCDPLCQASALALAVSQAVGKNMPKENCAASAPLPRACSPAYTFIRRQNMDILFCDIFSANDVQSSTLLWEAFGKSHGSEMQNAYQVALLATRADRPLRTKAFIDGLMGKPGFDSIQVVGNHGAYALLRGIYVGLVGVYALWRGSADLPRDSADLPQDSADLPQDSADLPQDSADLPQDSADLPQDSADLPQDSADLQKADCKAFSGAFRNFASLLPRALWGRKNAQPARWPCQKTLRWCPWLPPERLLDRLCQEARAQGKHKIVIVGMGNVHGYGQGWRSFLQEQAGIKPALA